MGTQIADLVAYPIATKIIFPERANLAFEIIDDKIKARLEKKYDR